MNRFLCIGIATTMALSSIAAPNQSSQREQFQSAVENLRRNYASTPTSKWHKDKLPDSKAQRAPQLTPPSGKVDNSSYWGSLFTPEGEEWLYTLSFEYEETFVENPYLVDGGYYTYSVNKANIEIYNADMVKTNSFSADLSYDPEKGETGINSVQISAALTKKFFNYNDAYEIMLYTHCTTADYSGNNYTYVYSLTGKDSATLVQTIDGYHTFAVNIAPDAYSERYTMAFLREGYETNDEGKDKYYLYFDIYSRPGYTPAAELQHTFAVDYELFAGAGEYALPFLGSESDGKIYYALPHYEIPFWEEDDYLSDPVPNEGNNFIIDLYDSSFNLVHTTKIPMSTKEGALYSFPGMGELFGHRDLDFSLFSNGNEPIYIVGMENYMTSSDDFINDLYVYDWDGNLLKTIVEDAADYMPMSDVPGCDTQYCFYLEEAGVFQFIDLPTCEISSEIGIWIEGSTYISTSIDRIATGNTYRYVSSLNVADVDEEGNALHRFAWFDQDGKFIDYQYFNLGADVAYAQAYIANEAFSPFLFNTDNLHEYMFLVKVYNDINNSGAGTSEFLRIYNDEGQILLNVGPDKENGSWLVSIYLQNPGTPHSKLVAWYSNGNEYTASYFDLPLTRFNGGDGSKDNPYHLATAGDLMQIHTAPGAYYVLDNDLDFAGTRWGGNVCTFTGHIDGKGYAVTNMVMTGNGIVSDMYSGATVSNLYVLNSDYMGHNGGFITGSMIGGSSKNTAVSNVHIKNCYARGDEGQLFGGISGSTVLYGQINDCSATNCDFYFSGASQVGGISGELMSSANVSNCYVSGTIIGQSAGGIASTSRSGDETIKNCHVDAEIYAEIYAGGIVAESSRTPIVNCYVEGTIKATGEAKAYAGGIAGYLDSYYAGTSSPNVHIQNCIVAADEIWANTEAPSHVAHRIVGSTSFDRPEIDWDHVTADMNYEDYPYLNPVSEKLLGQNYALDIAIIDSTIEDWATSTEGKTITLEQLVDTTASWSIGEDSTAPWQVAANGMVLYFEDVVNDYSGVSDVTLPTQSTIKFDGSTITANGSFTIYTTAGAKVLQGVNKADISNLASGLYIVTDSNSTLKIAIR